MTRALFITSALCVVSALALIWGNFSETTQLTSAAQGSGAHRVGELPAPTGYHRKPNQPGSFAEFLRRLPLKPPGQPVLLYTGKAKPDQSMVHRAIDLPIEAYNLHQCADAIIRLKALYEYQRGNFEAIRFHFTSGHLFRFDRYAAGWYPKIQGSQVTFQKRKAPGQGSASFARYLRLVYTYAGTLSLEREMKKISAADLTVGDVIIQGGSPGHGVIIVDEAWGPAGQKLFLMAQSYMPAQELHILKRPGGSSPWHRAPLANKTFNTREWKFPPNSFRRFK